MNVEKSDRAHCEKMHAVTTNNTLSMSVWLGEGIIIIYAIPIAVALICLSSYLYWSVRPSVRAF